MSFFSSVFDVSTELSVCFWEQVACNGCQIMFNINKRTWGGSFTIMYFHLCSSLLVEHPVNFCIL